MSATTITRDYSLIGPEADKAVAAGLASAKWYTAPIKRAELKELMRREDGPAIRDTLTWIAAFIVSGGLGYYFWGSWAAVPFFIVYGVLYGSSTDSRWHECGHRTAFKTQWILSLLLNIFALKNTVIFFRKVFLHATGRLNEEEATFVPEGERWKVYFVARIYLAIYALVIIACFVFGSILPAMYIGLPTLYGGWFALYCGVTQHIGLAEDVLDHRLNSRTVYMNPIFRFLYWNMNYHVEHHIFPTVPYHALPKLHQAIKADCPTPYPSSIAAYREIIPTVLRQLKEPTYFVRRELPPSAHPEVTASRAVKVERERLN
jgi:fatty acid desaturase